MSLLEPVAGIGRHDRTGGYRRFAWSSADMAMREWFVGEAAALGLDLVEDGNGNQLAWWGANASGGNQDALLIGSHLDSVPDGGAYDGPLGVVSSFAAVRRLKTEGFQPSRPVVVANFSDEEGARFGVACIGSRLTTGSLAPERVLSLTDDDGITVAEAMTAQGRDPRAVGAAEWLGSIGTFVELHVEQGRSLIHQDAAVGVATAIWPHGRWRLDFCGEANHAGATDMADRHDPMQAYAATVLASRELATEASARATFGRLAVEPGGTNAIPSRVIAWLDARAPDDGALERLVDAIVASARTAAEPDGTSVGVDAESLSPAVTFDARLRDRLASLLNAPVLSTGAGHDAGVLSPHVPTAMLFVRNPTGISHSPDEHASEDDCEAGVHALARTIRELT